ncbi:MAG: M14 family metallopeptidase [Candidatus Aminicenantales bacterium]
MKRNKAVILLTLGVLVIGFSARAQAQITSPETFFGFRLGSDRNIARWDKIVSYYELLGRESDKIKIVNLGPSTMGNPFLLVIISSPENLTRLEELRRMNLRLSDPRGLDQADIDKLIAEGKAVICQTMSLHASEIGGTQMAPELAFDLVSRGDEETRRILDNVVFLLVPSFNPDGEIMVCDWYRKTLGTEYEGSDLPWLYHKYAGHDNNRDAFQTNLVESQNVAGILFRDWIPQAYVDHHHMGSYGPRIYVPPYADPIRPLADPLIWREHSWYGAHIAYKEEEAGLSGVINAAEFSGWGHFGFHWITPFHNIAGMLTESASAKLATPMFIHPSQLAGGDRGFPAYEAQTTFPNPWPGGWWKLRDIVDRQKISAWAVLDLAARNRETVLRNAFLKAKRQIERGAQGKPAAFVIPTNQHDPLTAVKLVNKLLDQGIEIQRAAREFSTGDGRAYEAGSYLVSLAQPKMGLIRYLLGRTFYPDNAFTREPDGTPDRPYDMATDTMAEFMGVRVDPLDAAASGAFEKLTGPVIVEGHVAESANGHSLDGRLNDAFKAVSLLLDRNIAVRRLDRAAGDLRPGDFLVPSGTPDALLVETARATGVDFRALDSGLKDAGRAVKRMRAGMYQRYWGGNMDEGWTRFLLEQFAIPYTTLMDADIKKGGLNAKFDVLILPDDMTPLLMGENLTGWFAGMEDSTPPEYRSGIGTEGVEALKTFVERGGTLVALGEACDFAVEKLRLPVRNAVAEIDRKTFWCPGSTIRVKYDGQNPLAYGMPAEGLAIYQMGNPVFEIVPTEFNERSEIAVTFASRDLLQSGWLVGESYLADKAAVVSVKRGAGRVILFGIRPQHRAQTHGTFKLFFNALIQ